MSGIFISYRRDDAGAMARRLYDARERESFDAAVASARSALDEATFQSAWATGGASSLGDMLRLVDTD